MPKTQNAASDGACHERRIGATITTGSSSRQSTSSSETLTTSQATLSTSTHDVLQATLYDEAVASILGMGLRRQLGDVRCHAVSGCEW